MIKTKLLLIAERVIRDAETNNVSIINVIDEITVEAFPLVIPKITMLASLTREADDENLLNLKILASNNENRLKEHQIKVDFRGTASSRIIIKLGGVPLSEPGKLLFLLQDEKETTLGTYEITLKLREDVQVSIS